MKKHLLFFLITLLSLNSYSQISFEKGYFINNSNEKVDCFIKNIDWENNPTEFQYKLTENADEQKATIKTVKEFGIDSISKFVRHIVNIDKSSNTIRKMSRVKKPIFAKEELFLKVLIEGKANLYEYLEGDLHIFFFSKDDTEIDQLVFKKYLNTENKIAENNQFKQQLLNNLKCSTFKMSYVEKLDYLKNELVGFFVAYNQCNNEEVTSFEGRQKKDLFNLSFRPGINYSPLSLQNELSRFGKTDFESKIGFRFGIEGEYIMPFNKNKWSVLIEPSYQYFKSEKQYSDSQTYTVTVDRNIKANYESIEMPIGIRHYFFLSEDSKIFINGLIIFNLIDSAEIDFSFGPGLKSRSRASHNYALGLGYKIDDRFSLELRHHTGKNLLDEYVFWNTDYKVFSLIFGYSIF